MAENNDSKAPFGAGSLKAFGRLGLQELRGALYPESNVAQPTEQGMYGSATPQEVAKDKQEEAIPQKEESSLDRHLREATERAEIEREKESKERGMERERDMER